MGNIHSNSSSDITITLTNRSSDNPIYFLGEHVECTVQFMNIHHHSDLKLKDAYVELVGQFPRTTDIAQTNADGTTYTLPSIEQVAFFDQRRSLLTELTQVNTKEIHETGVSDKWSFSFSLPADLPPSFPLTIVYCIRVIIKMKKWHQRNFSHSIPITVYPRIDICNHLHHSLTLDINRKDIHFHATIPQSVITPGLHLPIQYDLHNPHGSIVEGIFVTLYQYSSLAKHKPHTTVIFKMDVHSVNKFQGENLHDQFELAIPTEVHLPTLFYTTTHNAHLTEFNPILVTYELQLLVKVHGICTDLTLTFPITMNAEVKILSPSSEESATNIS